MMVPPDAPQLPPLPKGYLFDENRRPYRYTRDIDHYRQQMKLYSACSCGSGKKYKFCCNGKESKEILVIRTPE